MRLAMSSPSSMIRNYPPSCPCRAIRSSPRRDCNGWRTVSAAAKADAPLAARSRVLGDILAYFGHGANPAAVSSVPDARIFSVAAYPNPFNPSTRIAFNPPQAGWMRLKVFDLRGKLVRTLWDEQRPAGPGRIVWDGRDDGGARVSSGVYFYEMRSGDAVRTGKLALVK